MKDPDNNVLATYTYDKNDNMVSQTDRAGTVTTMAYNARNGNTRSISQAEFVKAGEMATKIPVLSSF